MQAPEIYAKSKKLYIHNTYSNNMNSRHTQISNKKKKKKRSSPPESRHHSHTHTQTHTYQRPKQSKAPILCAAEDPFHLININKI